MCVSMPVPPSAGTFMCGWSAGWGDLISPRGLTAGRSSTRPPRRRAQASGYFKTVPFQRICQAMNRGSAFLFRVGLFRCGPCPVAAIQQHCLRAPHDTAFIYASVDADIVRLIVHNGRVVGRTVDTECVGQLIYTKRINSDAPENLTQAYKAKRSENNPVDLRKNCRSGSNSHHIHWTSFFLRAPTSQ